MGSAIGSGASPGPSSLVDSSPLLSPPLLLEIEEGTPAFEALRANADVRVSKLRKVGRSTRLQAGVRVLKSAARTASGQPGHASDRRGAPEFAAPPRSSAASREGAGAMGSGAAGKSVPTIPEVDEGESVDALDDRSYKRKASFESKGGKGGEAGPSEGDDEASQPLDVSITLDDSGTDRNEPLQPNSSQDARKTGQTAEALPLASHPAHRRGTAQPHVTRAALPAAIAAACRAGEDLDRERANQLADPPEGGSTGGSKESKSPFSHLFKPALAADDDASPTKAGTPQRTRPRNLRSASVPEGRGMFRRASVEKMQTTQKAHRMPSEISVAETEKHANFDAKPEEMEDLSDDGEGATDVEVAGDGGEAKAKEQVVTPIVVEVPGEKRRAAAGAEGAPDEDEDDALERTQRRTNLAPGGGAAVEEEGGKDADDGREALMAKAKKKMSRRSQRKKRESVLDDMHIHGLPKSVRRWVKSKRINEAEKGQRSYVKGKVIAGEHELCTMTIAVMFGMRTSIGRTNLAMSRTAHNERRWLDNEDLMAVEKYEFPPRGSDITPPHKLNHTFKFKDYSPMAFAYLRRMFGINEYDFLLSVCGNPNYIEFQSNAKSGQFFFYSPDGRYMIKTMTNTESKFLRRILPHYFRHCAMNPNTLVTKFLGMYRVKLYHLRRNVKFVVMTSVMDTDKPLHNLFDLKGSVTGRDAPGDSVEKDNDVRRLIPNAGAFMLEPGLRKRLRAQLEIDCQFLKSMKIMDYSMLVAVHNISYRNTKRLSTIPQQARVVSSDDGDDRSNSSFDASHATLDRYLDVDDDDSYLDGANQYNQRESKRRLGHDAPATSIRVVKASEDDESSKGSKLGNPLMVEKAIEDMYWPFHSFYDIHGMRRMDPMNESLIAPQIKKSNEDGLDKAEKKPWFELVLAPKAKAPMSSGMQYDMPKFERPLSFRKDGGFMMDTSTVDLPIKISVPGAPHVVNYCDGKIFYMGIIDILQQFNIRKRGEARWRRLGGKGWEAASCVHPAVYADRFLRFFDEYSATCPRQTNQTTENASVSDRSSNHSERVSPKVKRKTM
ncbi:hypothetical protein ACHAWF_015928 [Thalassiosira exigua]